MPRLPGMSTFARPTAGLFGTGGLEFRRVLSALDESGYDRFVSIKVYRGCGWEEAARSSAAFLRGSGTPISPSHRVIMSRAERGRAWPPADPSKPRPRVSVTLVLASVCVLAVITYIHRAGFGSNSPELLRELGMDVRDLERDDGRLHARLWPLRGPLGPAGRSVRGAEPPGRDRVRRVVDDGRPGGGRPAAADLCGPARVPPALRFLFGMFQAGTFPVLSRMMADWMPTTERGLAQGFIWMCSRGGGVLAPMLMVWLFQRLGDWRSPLVLGAGLGVLWCLAVWPWLRDRPEEMPRVNAAELALIPSGRIRQPPTSNRAPGRPSSARRTSGPCAGCTGSWATAATSSCSCSPTISQDYRHLDKETVKWLNVVPFACGVVACISGGYPLRPDRAGGAAIFAGRRLVGGSGMTLAGATILVTPWVDDLRWLAVLYGLTFLGNDLAMGPAWAAAGEIGERHAGTIAGAMNMFASLMAAVAAVVAGQFFHASSLAEKAGDLDKHGLYMNPTTSGLTELMTTRLWKVVVSGMLIRLAERADVDQYRSRNRWVRSECRHSNMHHRRKHRR